MGSGVYWRRAIAFIALRSWQAGKRGRGVAERNVSATMQSTGSAAVTGSDSDRDIGFGDRISNYCYFQRQHQTQKGGRGAGTCYETSSSLRRVSGSGPSPLIIVMVR